MLNEHIEQRIELDCTGIQQMHCKDAVHNAQTHDQSCDD